MTSGTRGASRGALASGVAAVTAGLSAVLAISATAGAAPADSASEARADAYASQARTLGLSSAEAKELQNRADSYLARMGGTQIAADRIQLGKGVVLRLALPTRADGARSGGSREAALCDYGHFCAFSDTGWTGYVIDMYQCAEWEIPWTWHGSWINNQTRGTRAQFRSSDHVTRWADSGAYSADGDADWSWVWYLKPC